MGVFDIIKASCPSTFITQIESPASELINHSHSSSLNSQKEVSLQNETSSGFEHIETTIEENLIKVVAGKSMNMRRNFPKTEELSRLLERKARQTNPGTEQLSMNF